MKLRAVIRFERPDDLTGWRRLTRILVAAWRALQEHDPDASLRVEPDPEQPSEHE